MMRFELPGRTTQALLASIALLSLFIVVHLLYPAAPSNTHTGALADDEAALPEFGNEALVPPALAALGEMLERPLFFVDRRIPEPPKDETPPPPPKPLRLKLQGIALAGGSRVAVLRNLSNNLLLQLAEGETHDGWTLDQVNSNSATFSRGEETTELPLDPDTSSGRR